MFFIDVTKKSNIIYIAVLMCAFSCLLPQIAGSGTDKWRLYYTSPDGSKYFYDTQVIERTS